MASASQLREALRPIVAFRGALEKAETEEQLQLLLLEYNLPERLTQVLDLHQALMLALALSARAQPTEEQQQVQQELVHENEVAKPADAEIFVAREADI